MQFVTILIGLVCAGIVLWTLSDHHQGRLHVTGMAVGGAIGTLLVSVALASTMVFIPFGSIGIITQNGALTGRVLQPGLNYKVPFIQGVWRMNTQTRALEIQNSSVFTRDQQNASNTYTINFSLDPTPAKLVEVAERFRGTEGGDTSIAERLIQPRAEYWLKQIEPNYNAADLLTHRSQVADALKARLQHDLTSYGIDLSFVSITNIMFGPEYQKASEARAAAEQEYQRELTVLKTKKVLGEQVLTTASYQARANQAIRDSLPGDPQRAEAIVEMQMVQLLKDKWDGTMPQALGSGSLLSIAKPELRK